MNNSPQTNNNGNNGNQQFQQPQIHTANSYNTFNAQVAGYLDQRHYTEQIAQESWVVVKGSVKCTFYDIDDTIIATPILYSGDASFTLLGGHTYEILENDTIVYEYKTGPYEGQKLDKVFI